MTPRSSADLLTRCLNGMLIWDSMAIWIFCDAVKNSIRWCDWKIIPILDLTLRRSLLLHPLSSCPKILREPSCIDFMQPISVRRVVLPQPEGPTSETNSPDLTKRFIFLRTLSSTPGLEYRYDRFFAWTTGSDGFLICNDIENVYVNRSEGSASLNLTMANSDAETDTNNASP